MSVGTLLATVLLLIGLTIQSGMSWRWWVAALLIGTVVNLSFPVVVKWWVKQK